MTMDPAERGRLVTRQFAITAIAEGALLAAIVVFHEFQPLPTWGLVLVGVLAAVGVAAAVMTIYRAVRLAAEPSLRAVAFLTIALVVVTPVLLWFVQQLQ